MIKVLVDPAALEEAAKWLEVHSSSSGSAEAFAAEALREAIAQPAEAEGVQLRRYTPISQGDHMPAMNSCDQGGWVRHSDHLAALSAVTAERDRLREEMAELWKRIDKFQSQSHGITALAEIERLRAEVGRYVPLHEAVQRAADELPEGWAIQLYIERDGGGVELIGPDGTEDFATNNERLDYTVIDALEAAMAAKEAR